MFHLTRQERAILIVFIFIFLLGLSFQYAFKKNPHLWNLVNLIESDTIYPKIDVNKASYEELIKVPYIGPVTAKRIISYRESKGPFQKLDELKSVKGVSHKRYHSIIKFLKITSS